MYAMLTKLQLTQGNAYVDKVKAAVIDEQAAVLIISAQIESEIAQLETYDERTVIFG